jgi:hypothetical protein
MSLAAPASGISAFTLYCPDAIHVGVRYKMRDEMHEPIHPVQIEGFRRMTPAQKLQMLADLYETGIQLRVAGLRRAHPDWPVEHLEFEARRSLLYAGT